MNGIELLEFIRKHGLNTRQDAIVHFGETANIQPVTQEFRDTVLLALSDMSIIELQKRLDKLRMVDIDGPLETRLERINKLIQEIEVGGWKVGVFAYRDQVTKTRNGKRALRVPRWQWHTVGHWFKGNIAVWYYNNQAFLKEYAVDQTKRTSVPDWFKAEILKGTPNPERLVV